LHPVELATRITTGDRTLLAALATELGFAESRKTAANIEELRGHFPAELLAKVVLDAGHAADPDCALNGLERLTTTLNPDYLIQSLASDTIRQRLLMALGASQFLTNILCRKPRYFENIFVGGATDIPREYPEMIRLLRERIAADANFATLQSGLRSFKREEMLRIATRDLCGLADLQQTTAELADLAAATLQRACEVCATLLRAEYGAPLLDSAESEVSDRGETAQGEAEFCILGMGKLGGRELNFSSDIDLIYLYSSDRGRTGGITDPSGRVKNQISLHQYFVKMGGMITKAIGEATDDGFVFRVDLDLRPGGQRGEMANSLGATEIYYESWGQSWERAAMLKARPVAGALQVGEELLERLIPFIYRRSLDYTMIEDIKRMKQKIDNSLAYKNQEETNLKLGRGGIREIEFFIQALLLIHAGKKPALRERNSLQALALLHDEKLITSEEFQTLHAAYVFLRTIEHRIQIYQERQTHNMPTKEVELRCLARRSGFTDVSAFLAELGRHRDNVAAIYHDLFYSGEEELRDEIRPEIHLLFDASADADLIKDLLAEKGFTNVDRAYDALLALRTSPARLTERAQRLYERITPLLMQAVTDSPEPDMALANLEKFLTVKRARGGFYALLAENPPIIKLLVSLFGTSQYLSRNFILHPEILDTLVSSAHAKTFRERDELRIELVNQLAESDDYEDRLDILRRFRNQEFLRIALNDIHGDMQQGACAMQLTWLADVCLEQAVELACEELLPRFGLPFGQGEDAERAAEFAIIAMGKHGGMELNYHSDLDLIFIYDIAGRTRPVSGTETGRFRELSNQEYFAKLAQRIISILTLATREGYVYQIDTRLRPSGNQGPLVTSLAAFTRYHESSAQLWERQALLKARVIGPAALTRTTEELLTQIVYLRPLPAETRSEIVRLRERMEQEIAHEGDTMFNIKTGRGGMVDVEFLTQYLQLRHGGGFPDLRQVSTLPALTALHREGLIAADDFNGLYDGYKFLRRLENKLRLVHDQSINQLSNDRDYLTKLAQRLGYPEHPLSPHEALLRDYRAWTERIRSAFLHCLAEEVEVPS